MILPIIIAAIVLVLTILVLERNIKSRLAFYAFCGSMLLALSIVGYGYYTSASNSYEELDESAIRHITAQQLAFGEWYTNYKKKLDAIDYCWVSYYRIMKDFKNDDISLPEAYTRLAQLESNVVNLHNEIYQLDPPISLDDANYDLTSAILKKTKAYADAQLRTVRATKLMADPEKMHTDNHEVQVGYLNDAMLMNSPDMLFTAAEINSLRHNLTIPEVN
ncbi:hypothetical protein D081_2075 [Anaerovibrio sp. JC8]|uniref:hypothetical protein n=1 Tax=Anaerovibrio sp. JC8 TaxID=1240085 RepID=UPI000A0AB5BA|nr:hypothetical protein [Anaerovibrio sp. JC8]ORT99210.1 hypothetical protein D081_2075 [Anaerovibrio sp. JC8]